VDFHENVLGITANLPHTSLDVPPYKRDTSKKHPASRYTTDFTNMAAEVLELGNTL
jgi:hypothetical protein